MQIYAVEEQPIPYLVMEYIPGRTLQKKLDDTGPLEHPEMLRLAVQIAHGLAAAHAQGLIHRDIKPSNILLDEGIEPRVKITDFGLARAADDASLTQSGVVAGTPMYMAPEQAEGKTLDQRADQFSLGSVFYVMLSGRPPFRASGTMAVLKRVCEDTPRPIRELIPEVPEWLCDVIGKLQAKKPEERFQTAAEVGDLLSQHLAHAQQPHLAPLPRPVEVRRPAGRRRWQPAALAAGVVLAIVAIVAAVPVYRWLRPPELLPPDTGNPLFAPAPKRTAEELAKMPSVFDGRKRDDIPRALLAQIGGGDPDLAPPECVALWGDARKFPLPDDGARGFLCRSDDGNRLAVPCGNSVVLYDARTGDRLRTFAGNTSRVFAAAFSHDGKLLASGAGDGKVLVWDIHTGQAVTTCTGHTGTVFAVAFSADNKRLLTGSADQSGRMWDVENGKEIFALLGHTGGLLDVAFSPDGKRLATAGIDGTARVWEADKGKELECLKGHTRYLQRVAFSPNGTLLASGSDNEAVLWSTDTWQPLHTLRAPAGWLAFDLDGQTLLTANHDTGGAVHKLMRWNTATGKEAASFRLQSQGLYGQYALSPDGKTLFATRDVPDVPYVRSYNAVTGAELLPKQPHDGPIYCVAVSPDGKLLASSGADRNIKLWDLAAWKAGDALPPARTLPAEHSDIVRAVVFSPNGKLLMSASNDHTVVVWDVERGEVFRTLPGTGINMFRPAFSPDGRSLAVGYDDGSVRLWNLTENKEPALVCRHTSVVRCMAFSPDGQRLASGSEDRMVFVTDLATGRRLQKFPLPHGANNVAFGFDGKTLAAVGDVWGVQLWDVATWKPETLPGHVTSVHGLEFSPIAPLLATRSTDGTVRFWDRTTDNPRSLSIQVGPAGGDVNACFTPEGRYLVTGISSGAIVILKVPQPPPPYEPGPPIKLPDPLELAKRPSAADNLQRKDIPVGLFVNFGLGKVDAPPELAAILAHGDKGITGVAISPNGSMLASAGGDCQSAIIWDLATGKPLHKLPTSGHAIFETAFVPTRDKGPNTHPRLATTGGASRTAKLWDVQTGKELHTLGGHIGNVYRLAASPDGRWLATADQDGLIHVWDPATGKHLRALRRLPGEWGDLAASPDGRVLATADADGVVRLWDPLNGWLLATLVGHQGSARGLAFRPDGRMLASSSNNDRTIRLWDLTTLKQVKSLEGTRSIAVKLAWRGDGGLLAADDNADGKVRLWDPSGDPSRHRTLSLFPNVLQSLHGIAMTPEGRYLASANADGTIYILRLAEPGEVYQVPSAQSDR